MSQLLQEVDASEATEGAAQFRNLDYAEVCEFVNKHCSSSSSSGGGGDAKNGSSSCSTELDVLITYVHGQAALYAYAHNYTLYKYHCIMVPCIVLSSFQTLSSPFLVGGVVGYVVNALIMLLLSVLSFKKWESASTSFRHIAARHESLKLSLELASNKLFYEEDRERREELVREKIREFEGEMIELGDKHGGGDMAVLLPANVKVLFPFITYINIFSFIKKMELYKRSLILQLQDCKNEIRYIKFMCKHYASAYLRRRIRAAGTNTAPPPPSSGESGESGGEADEDDDLYGDDDAVDAVDAAGIVHHHRRSPEEKRCPRLRELLARRADLKREISNYGSAYDLIEELFVREIRHAETHFVHPTSFFFARDPQYSFHKTNHPIVDKYLESMLVG